VGGPGDNNYAGAAWVFTRSGQGWHQQAKLVGTGAGGSNGAAQGQSVSLSGDGNIAIVGGPQDNNNLGAAWVFTRSGGVWNQQGPKLVGTGSSSGFTDGSFLVLQGDSVALSGDGNTAIVGGPDDNQGPAELGFGPTGAAWVYARPVFAGTLGKANCHGQSVTALAGEYGGLNNAAAALGYSSVSALQNAIMAYCET
jgi:hypothetical protein